MCLLAYAAEGPQPSESGMKIKLTQTSVKNLLPGDKDVIVWDADLAGFAVKVTPAGRKVFFVERRVGRGRGATKRRVTIGVHGAFAVEVAREAAKAKLRELEDGIDPVALEEAARATQDAAVEAATKLEAAALVEGERAKERAFSTLAERYIERRIAGKDSAKLKASIIRRRFVTAWGERDMATLGREDVAAVLDAIIDEGHPAAAWNALRTIRPLFAYAVERGLIQVNPAAKVRPDAEELSRDRTLTDAELIEVWRAAGELAYPFGSMVRLLVLTGQRRNEVAGMRFAELSLGVGVWTIPSARTKNEKAHIVHLSSQALDVLASLPRLSDEFVLTTTGRTAISGFSKAKQRLDDTILANRRKAAAEAGADPAAAAPMAEWNIHDLRRTFATGMAEMGIQPHITEKVLNHNPKALSGVAGVYNRHEYMSERKAALDAWGRRVETLVADVGAYTTNVIPLRA